MLTLSTQLHIRGLVQQSATHIMRAGGVVRKIESWGTMQLPQRMKKKRTSAYEQIGEYVSHTSILSLGIYHFVLAIGHFIVMPVLKLCVP